MVIFSRISNTKFNFVNYEVDLVYTYCLMDRQRRNLKVVRGFSAKPKPSLPLAGCWLEKAGFKIGMRVDVQVQPGCLIITPIKPNEK